MALQPLLLTFVQLTPRIEVITLMVFFLSMENNILTVHVNPHKVMTWEGLGSSIISFAVPRNAGFLQGFRGARARFSAQWAALEETDSFLYHQYQCARVQSEGDTVRTQQDANMQFQELQNRMAHIYQEAMSAKTPLEETQAQFMAAPQQLSQREFQWRNCPTQT
ncbi:uncharacterized protein TM35_000093010 [Trypanosoma theileri]|uniref:Uncharacterized protein n=1 Tax=Trypanosoma theileri TaxID=67003 RepID=A0A1X0P073_9TRYP|nr:uncharacterized protein TM35_000093010 [Trypanosoma theileri]ORC90251.1 hypothetical protein TM35_000093010 [Trypanosoma theileri]